MHAIVSYFYGPQGQHWKAVIEYVEEARVIERMRYWAVRHGVAHRLSVDGLFFDVPGVNGPMTFLVVSDFENAS